MIETDIPSSKPMDSNGNWLYLKNESYATHQTQQPH